MVSGAGDKPIETPSASMNMGSSKPIFLVGEAWGENEARLGVPFVGASGVELLRMLHEAGVIELTSGDRNRMDLYYRTGDPNHLDKIWLKHPEVYRTNVFNSHPPGNRLEHFCGGKADGIPGYGPLLPSKYVRTEFEPELARLGDEIIAADPNLIICLGNCAVWAFTGHTGVSKLRGTTTLSTHCVGDYKLLVAYHPAAVLRQYELRPTTIADLSKAVYERESGALVRPPCEIWIEPDAQDIKTFIKTYIPDGTLIAVDIETAGSTITCIGFAARRDLAIVIPFLDVRKTGRSYWPTAEDERFVWGIIRQVLENPKVYKVFQNGMYDMAFLWRAYGIRTLGAKHDSMLAHHALQPEALKGLGYLGSLYTSWGAWKSDRKHTDTIKRDE